MADDYKVPLTRILAINPHPNADRLEIAKVYDFDVVTQKGKYQPGNYVVYVPIDSILPKDLEDKLFPKESKIKLTNSRVRQCRIRQFPSQGLLIDPDDLDLPGFTRLEDDLSEIYGIKKYEPPVVETQGNRTKKQSRKLVPNPNFHGYNGIDNAKYYPDLFKADEEVVVQCKLHGTNARLGKLKFYPNTLWKKIKSFFKLAPEYELVYGSNNVQISDNGSYKGFYQEDLYGRTFKRLNIADKVKDNELVYGEIIGEGIQKNYHYGHREPYFVLFDVKTFNPDGTWQWLNPDEAEQYAKDRGFDFVPVLYKGLYSKDEIAKLVSGPSVYCPEQKVREGITIKSRYNYNDPFMSSSKRVVKWINPEYLDDTSNSDNH